MKVGNPLIRGDNLKCTLLVSQVRSNPEIILEGKAKGLQTAKTVEKTVVLC